MNWVHTLTLVAHVLLAAAIIGLVLLQRGRGADAGAGFGAGASGTVFGARGSASFLSRMTATMAALFFVTSLALAYLGGQTSAPVSILDTVPATTFERPQVVPESDAPLTPAPETTPEPAQLDGGGDAATDTSAVPSEAIEEKRGDAAN